MKISIETSTLARELFKTLGLAVAKTMPVTAHVLFIATPDGKLNLHATDLDCSLSSVAECTVNQPGRVCVHARDLYNAVKSLRASTVEIEGHDNHSVSIVAGSVRAKFNGLDPLEFPSVYSGPNPASVLSISSRSFVRAIEQTIFSISTDSGRPNLTGAQVSVIGGNTLRMVSTDGHRLSVVNLALPAADGSIAVPTTKAAKRSKTAPAPESDTESAPPPPHALADGLIVPKNGLAELRRIVDPTVETIDIGVDGSSIVFRCGATTLRVRAIDGSFPNIKNVLPKEQDVRRARINRKDFLACIRAVSSFASEKTGNITITFSVEECTVSAANADKGEFLDKVPLIFGAAPVAAAFNFKYLVDVLSAIDTEFVTVEIVDKLTPAVLRAHEPGAGEDAVFVVMPLRI